MAQNQRERNNRKSNEDKVLRTSVMAVFILFLVGALIVGIKSLNPRPDTTEGIKKLEAMEQTKIKTVQKELKALDEKEAKAQEELSKRPNKEKFKDTLILGDYIAQGIYEQEVLGESFVLAGSEACVADTDGTSVTTNLEAAAKQKPKVLFLVLGVNDAAREGNSAELFKDQYSVFLERVKEKLPKTRIFVNSILPVQTKAVEENAGYAQIPQYNEILKKVCKEAGAIYIDNSDLVKDDYYKEDGKHMKKKYYTLWADRMVQAADL